MAVAVLFWVASLTPGAAFAKYSLLYGLEPGAYSGFWNLGPAPPSFGLGISTLRLDFAAENSYSTQTFRFSLDPAASGLPAGADPNPIWGAPPAAPVFVESPDANVLRGVRNASSPYSKKFMRGTVIITGAELLCGVVLAVLPSQYTKWDDTALERGASNFKRAWSSPPVWDGDIFFHNWLGHPYAGAFYYNMIRSQGGTSWQSVKFTLFQTLMWEYVIEAVAEQPSIQDLIMTPIAGSLLGELFHRWSVSILQKGSLNFWKKALVFFLNPSYVINNGYRQPE